MINIGKLNRDSGEPRIHNCHHPQCEKIFLDKNSYRKHLITHGEKQVKRTNNILVHLQIRSL